MRADPQAILVVDHAPSLRELLDIFLSDEGYAVSGASLDVLSVEHIVERPVGLYIVGLKPAEPEDLELLEQLHRQQPRSRVIVLATCPQLLDTVRSQPERYAGDRFLRLPLDLNDLLRDVRSLVGCP